MNALEASRYRWVPQMRDYDSLQEKRWVPYTMFFQHPRRQTPAFSTDDLGFRTTVQEGRPVSFEAFCASDKPRAAVVGGSTAFGVGATSDAQTLASHLNRAGDRLWFNFAGRAFNSTQEWLVFLLHLPPSVETVILFTGVNNLALSHLAGSTSPIYNSFYVQSVFEKNLAKGLRTGVQAAAVDLVRELGRKARSLWAPPVLNGASQRVSDEGYRHILTCFARDLRIWHLLRQAMGFRLCFAFQPVASWIPKALCAQEKEMFDLLDQAAPEWDALAGHLKRWAPRYLKEVRGMCESLQIPFLDLNDCPAFRESRWLFVDRVHLTDQGYALAAEEIRRAFLS
jgi:hypothetical protein